MEWKNLTEFIAKQNKNDDGVIAQNGLQKELTYQNYYSEKNEFQICQKMLWKKYEISQKKSFGKWVKNHFHFLLRVEKKSLYFLQKKSEVVSNEF